MNGIKTVATIATKPRSDSLDIPALRESIQKQAENGTQGLVLLQSQLAALDHIERKTSVEIARLQGELKIARTSSREDRHPDRRPLMRRAFHAINRLHPPCNLQGCDLCKLKQDIIGVLGAYFLMSKNQVSE